MANETRNLSVGSRKGIIGCSDIGAILGVNPFAGKHWVWESYMGIEHVFDDETLERMEIGHQLEDIIFNKWLETQSGVEQVARCQDTAFSRPDMPYFICHPDYLVRYNDERVVAVEVKSSTSAKAWDDVPTYYIAQCHGYKACMVPFDDIKLIRGYGILPVTKNVRKLDEYDIDIDMEVVDAIINEVRKAHDEWESGIEPPQDYTADVKAWLGKTVKDPIQATDDIKSICDRMHSIDCETEQLEMEKELLSEQVKKFIGLHQTLVYGDAKLYSYTETKGRESFDRKSLLRDHPELKALFAVYTKFGTPFRTLRKSTKKEG